MRLRELKEIVENNSLEYLIDKYKHPYIIYENDDKYNEEIIQIQLYHRKGSDTYYLDYFEYSSYYDRIKTLTKKIFFSSNNNKNIVLYGRLINNHSYYEGLTIDF